MHPIFICIAQPHVIQLSSNDSLIVQPDSVTLTCVVTNGYPTTSIQWYSSSAVVDINDHMIEESSYQSMDVNFTNSSLTIMNMDPFDAAMYTCNASNIAGYDTDSINLTVNGKPCIVCVSKSETCIIVTK